MFSRVVATFVLATGLAATFACGRAPGDGADAGRADRLDPGMVVAAVEASGGVRVYKIVHTERMPAPLGEALHLVAYGPTAESFDEAERLRQRGGLSVALEHVFVRRVSFAQRDHRVLAVEPVTDEERAAYERSR